jgi:hypothetical protein
MFGNGTRMSLMAVGLLAVAGCDGSGLPSPRAELAAGQAMLDLNESIIQLREENAMVQAQVDSLAEVVARQDSLLRQVAAQSGIPLPPPR